MNDEMIGKVSLRLKEESSRLFIVNFEQTGDRRRLRAAVADGQICITAFSTDRWTAFVNTVPVTY